MKHNFMTKMVSALLAVVLSTAAFSITAFASGGEETTESVAEQETTGAVSDLLSALAGSQVTVSVTEDGIQFSSGENDSEQTGTVTTGGGNLNVRTGAGMDYTAFTQLPNGTTVKVIGTDGDWLKVILPEKVGYVYSGYMTVSDGEAGSGEGSFSLDAETLENLLGMLGGGLNGGAALTPDGNLSLIDDIGSPATSGKQFITVETKNGNADIISSLGVGIVWFDERPPEGEIEAPDVEYRVDTDVITSVTLRTDTDLTPDNPASVTFHILGTTYRVNDIVIPAGDSQVVWVKWHTPSTPQSVTITVSVSGAYTAQDTFVAEIVDLNEHIPPDPTATDTNPNYTVPSLPNEPQKLTANWGVWSCYWVPVWVWCDHDDWGHWVDEGYWEYEYTGYSASISGVMSLMPDDIVPTASGKSMKSGYGVKQDVTATLSTDAPTSHITHPQTAFSVFPEFQYETYLRLLQRVSSGRSAKFTFQPNEFSTYNRTVHFSPLWFPDSTDYTVFTQVWDTWTPDGMLSINLNDYVSIDGSLYDDWYTNRE